MFWTELTHGRYNFFVGRDDSVFDRQTYYDESGRRVRREVTVAEVCKLDVFGNFQNSNDFGFGENTNFKHEGHWRA